MLKACCKIQATRSRSPAVCMNSYPLAFTMFSEGKAEIVTSKSESCVGCSAFYCVLHLEFTWFIGDIFMQPCNCWALTAALVDCKETKLHFNLFGWNIGQRRPNLSVTDLYKWIQINFQSQLGCSISISDVFLLSNEANLVQLQRDLLVIYVRLASKCLFCTCQKCL